MIRTWLDCPAVTGRSFARPGMIMLKLNPANTACAVPTCPQTVQRIQAGKLCAFVFPSCPSIVTESIYVCIPAAISKHNPLVPNCFLHSQCPKHDLQRSQAFLAAGDSIAASRPHRSFCGPSLLHSASFQRIHYTVNMRSLLQKANWKTTVCHAIATLDDHHLA